MQPVYVLEELVGKLLGPVFPLLAQELLHLPPVGDDARYPDSKLDREPLPQVDRYFGMDPCALKFGISTPNYLNQFRCANSRFGLKSLHEPLCALGSQIIVEPLPRRLAHGGGVDVGVPRTLANELTGDRVDDDLVLRRRLPIAVESYPTI